MLGVVSDAPSARPSPDGPGAPLSVSLRRRAASCRQGRLSRQWFHRDVRGEGATEAPYTENGLLVAGAASVDEMASGGSAAGAGTARPPGVAPCGDANDAGSSPAVASSCWDGTTPRAVRMRHGHATQPAPSTGGRPLRAPHARLDAPYCGASTGVTIGGAARWPNSAAVTEVGAAGAGAARASSSSAAAATSCDAGGRCRSRQTRPQSAAMDPLVAPPRECQRENTLQEQCHQQETVSWCSAPDSNRDGATFQSRSPTSRQNKTRNYLSLRRLLPVVLGQSTRRSASVFLSTLGGVCVPRPPTSSSSSCFIRRHGQRVRRKRKRWRFGGDLCRGSP